MYHDQTTRPLQDIRWELLTLLSHGAFVTMVDKTGFDGALDPLAYERTGEAFAEAQAKRPHFGHTPVADVGIYFSSRTRDWVGREKPAEWFLSFLGAHKALVYDHIPYGVTLDENATLDSLLRFPVVLVPNAGIVSERDVIYCIEAEGEASLSKKVGEVMTAPAITATPATKVDEALELMTRRRIRHLPVVDGGAMCGFVSIGDLVKSQVDDLAREAEAMRSYIQSA